MNLAGAPGAYDPRDQAKLRQALQQADAQNFKSGRDLRLENGERLILKASDGSRWALVVSTAGVLSTTGPL